MAERRRRGDNPRSPFRLAAMAMGVIALLVVCWFCVLAVLEMLAP